MQVLLHVNHIAQNQLTIYPGQFPNLVKVYKKPYDACLNAHDIAVLTEWDEFKGYDWQRIYDGMMKPAYVFDGRNVLIKKKLEEVGV